jgi:hypothetical protein
MRPGAQGDIVKMKRLFLPAVLLGLLAGCKTEHKVVTENTVAIQPIHITLDINLKIDKALDDFFNDLD